MRRLHPQRARPFDGSTKSSLAALLVRLAKLVQTSMQIAIDENGGAFSARRRLSVLRLPGKSKAFAA
jgi:hypothetical protein